MTVTDNNIKTDERAAIEERIAILKAVICPGKTHNIIKNRALRTEFARELNDWRNQRNQGRREGLGELSKEEWIMWRGGLESAFWALQKAEGRAFLYENRRVSWQMVEEQDTRTPEERTRYAEYEAAVVATHMKTLNLKAKVEAEFNAGIIDKTQRARLRIQLWHGEDDKIKALQEQFKRDVLL
jgi:hypothetical protein